LTTSMLDIAKRYTDRGYSIIPLRTDKRPLLPWMEFQRRKASVDELLEWWTKTPTANIGIVTGGLSDLVVVDVDDMQDGLVALAEHIPASIETPTAKTPSGGMHFYFKHPGGRIENNRGTIPGCDLQADGGYIVAPPSHCEYRKKGKDIVGDYTWIISPEDLAPAPLPLSYIKALDSFNTGFIYKGGCNSGLHELTELTKAYVFEEEPGRDVALFHVANCLVKGGCDEATTRNILTILASHCEPPFDLKDANIKIDSALKRAAKRERDLSKEIREWWSLQEGYEELTKCFQSLQVLTREERRHGYVVVHRLKEEGFLEKYGNKAGVYRRVDKNFEKMDILSASGKEANIELPLGLGDLAKLYPGNIAVIAGSKEAGKTAFLLNVAAANLGKKKIVYLNSEMGEDEFKNRLLGFGSFELPRWVANMDIYKLRTTQMPSDYIDGSDTIWIVDYLEIAEDFSKIALPLAKIHEKLGQGLALIGLQKADGKDVGRGADFSREKARLYLSLDWDADRKQNRIKIIDCKSWRDRNPRGLCRYYKLVKGAGIIPQGNWE